MFWQIPHPMDHIYFRQDRTNRKMSDKGHETGQNKLLFKKMCVFAILWEFLHRACYYKDKHFVNQQI